MLVTGDRARFLTLLDRSFADSDDTNPAHSIDVFFHKSELGKKVGQIVVYKAGAGGLPQAPAHLKGPALKEWNDEQAALLQNVESTFLQERFSQEDGRWIEWAMKRALELYDRYGGARMAVKVTKLKIKQWRSSKSVGKGRGDVNALFPVLRDIDGLLDNDFAYDPWTGMIRRGTISAVMGNR